MEIVDNENTAIRIENTEDGNELHIFDDRIIKKNVNGEILVQYLLTTPGRILLNKILLDSLVNSKIVKVFITKNNHERKIFICTT